MTYEDAIAALEGMRFDEEAAAIEAEVARLTDADEIREAAYHAEIQARAKAEAEVARLRAAVEAGYRYFDHCQRVSLSARHAGCNSPEMGVRLALMREAREAIKAAKAAGGNDE